MTDLESFLAPRSIAVVGASASPQKIGAAPLRYLLEHRYAGELFAINPRAQEVQGLRTHASLREVGRPIDLAIFALPAAGVEAALEDAIHAQVRNIVMFSAGFAEAGEEGREAQARLAARARGAGIRLLGPNCLGFMNLAHAVYATFSPVVSTGLVAVGSVGIVSQSGALGAYAYAIARRSGMGLSSWITTGNEVDIQVADCIAWMARDPATRVIMACLEGCQDGDRLRAALEAARAAGKPVVAVKVGRTALGAAAAASHTAALAGDDAAYDALFRQYGVWRARGIEELFDIARALEVAGLPSNPQVGLLTVSGGVGVMMADDAADAGLEVPPLPQPVQDSILSRVPLAATRNPVDLTGQVTAEPEVLAMAARAMLGAAGHGSLLIFLAAFGLNPAMQRLQQELARDLRREFPDRVVIFSTLADEVQQRAIEATGCLSFADPSRAIRVLAALTFYQAQRARPTTAPVATAGSALSIAPGSHNEADAMDLLGRHGLPMVPMRRAVSRDEAVAAATAVGFPVVIKVLSADITHKSDAGGVVLNVADAEAAGAAWDRIHAAVPAALPHARIDGVLVAPMVHQGVECILGVHRDPTFGPVLMLGSGGTNVELLGDVVFRLAPVGPAEALDMVDSLRTAALLRGYRGAPKADVQALVQAIVRLSDFAIAAGDTLVSAELNPFVVLPQGQGACALDAVLEGRPAADPPAVLDDWVVETLPLFEMTRMRASNTARRHPTGGFAGDSADSRLRWVNQFTHTRRLRGPDDREVVTPNNDTLFTNAWLDLSAGPLVIDVPAMGARYWVLGFLDAWTNPWAYAGRRTTGGQAQRLFVYGPRWSGDLPEGLYPIAAPTTDVWIIGRILTGTDAEDLARVHALQDRFAIRRWDGGPALARLDTLVDDRGTGVPDAAEYLRVLRTMLPRNPPAVRSAGPPCFLQPDAGADEALHRALQPALHRVYTDLRDTAQPSGLGGGWTTGVSVRTGFGDDFLTRARVARNWIGTLGIDEAMYIMAEVDADGTVLTGEHRYRLRFPPGAGPQVGAFWSITLYGRSDCLLVDNPIGRHSIGDRTPGLRVDADGGLSIAIQAADPGPGCNWLPAPPAAGFYLVMRLYQPQAAHLEGDFAYPPVQRID